MAGAATRLQSGLGAAVVAGGVYAVLTVSLFFPALLSTRLATGVPLSDGYELLRRRAFQVIRKTQKSARSQELNLGLR